MCNILETDCWSFKGHLMGLNVMLIFHGWKTWLRLSHRLHTVIITGIKNAGALICIYKNNIYFESSMRNTQNPHNLSMYLATNFICTIQTTHLFAKLKTFRLAVVKNVWKTIKSMN